MEEQANSKIDANERLSVLRQLIRAGDASTQDELCRALKMKKFNVTQSTVSRDLRRIGAMKATNAEGEVIYRLPEDQPVLPLHLSHDLGTLVTEVVASESMIVIHTTPGSASLVARHIDSLKTTIGILGTIAGDDTIFIVPASAKKIALVIKKIKEEL